MALILQRLTLELCSAKKNYGDQYYATAKFSGEPGNCEVNLSAEQTREVLECMQDELIRQCTDALKTVAVSVTTEKRNTDNI